MYPSWFLKSMKILECDILMCRVDASSTLQPGIQTRFLSQQPGQALPLGWSWISQVTYKHLCQMEVPESLQEVGTVNPSSQVA